MGKQTNRAKSLTDEEIEVLWSSNQLGRENPRTLIQTVWWHNCLHFGMRSREEHHGLKIEDFTIEYDSIGRKFVSFNEGPTKTRNKGLKFQPRLIKPKMFATGGPRCPVFLFEEYKRRRPTSMINNGPFYLSVIDKPKSKCWYKQLTMGKNTINTFLKNMKMNSPLSESDKRITNHSA